VLRAPIAPLRGPHEVIVAAPMNVDGSLRRATARETCRTSIVKALAELTFMDCFDVLVEAMKLAMREHERAVEAAGLLPGWTCWSCSAFNGTAKEDLGACRCCGVSRVRPFVETLPGDHPNDLEEGGSEIPADSISPSENPAEIGAPPLEEGGRATPTPSQEGAIFDAPPSVYVPPSRAVRPPPPLPVARPVFGPVAPVGSGKRPCGTCGKLGHLRKHCPTVRPSYAPTLPAHPARRPRPPAVCRRCHGTGHYARFCPMDRPRQAPAVEPRPVPVVEPGPSAPSPQTVPPMVAVLPSPPAIHRDVKPAKDPIAPPSPAVPLVSLVVCREHVRPSDRANGCARVPAGKRCARCGGVARNPVVVVRETNSEARR